MLIACPSCHRQFDVGDLTAGAKVRCLCSKLLEVPEVRPRDLEMLRCASCGGNLGRGDKECGFCGSEVGIAERGYGGTCPECFARMVKDAKYCSTCGIGIDPVGQLQPLHDRACPRCDATLAVQEFAGGSLVECTGCGGVWLQEEDFTAATAGAASGSVAGFIRARSGATADCPVEPPRETQVRYLKCPTCQNLMHRKNFASCSGVIVDWCRGHGYWFDRHELEVILNFVAAGGLEVSRARERERNEAAARRAAMRSRELRVADRDVGLHGPAGTVDLFEAIGGFLRGLFR